MNDALIWIVLLGACWSISLGVAKLVTWVADQAHARARRRYVEALIVRAARKQVNERG